MKQHNAEFVALVEAVRPHIREIEAAAMRALPKASYQLIDVREDRERADGFIPDSKHLSRGIIERDIVSAIPDKSTHLVLYCGGGYRSALAADNLQKMGYANVSSLIGGWSGWCAAGYETENA